MLWLRLCFWIWQKISITADRPRGLDGVKNLVLNVPLSSCCYAWNDITTLMKGGTLVIFLAAQDCVGVGMSFWFFCSRRCLPNCCMSQPDVDACAEHAIVCDVFRFCVQMELLVEISVYIMDISWHSPNTNRAMVTSQWTAKDSLLLSLFRVTGYTSKFTVQQVRSTFRRAFSMWQSVSNLRFYEIVGTTDELATADIQLRFATQYHGDSFPFDSEGRKPYP